MQSEQLKEVMTERKAPQLRVRQGITTRAKGKQQRPKEAMGKSRNGQKAEEEGGS